MTEINFQVNRLSKRYNNRPKILILNDILSLAVLFLAFYILSMPLLPQATLFISQKFDQTAGYKYVSNLAEAHLNEKKLEANILRPIPQTNTLVIPKIGVDGQIYESESAEVLEKGIWHRPNTSTPDKGGNSVFIAHRFLYQSGPNTFYHLDKLTPGDQFIVFWEGKEYDYQVIDSQVVPATSIEIEYNSSEPIVTLYTCHPLWTSTNRLVIRAKLI